MAVPARPTSGVPIETAWGQVAHDTAVGMDIQTGVAAVVLNNAVNGNLVVTFPRPFASPPVVVASVNTSTSAFFGYCFGATATTVAIGTSRKDTAVSTATVPVSWIAYGPRA